MESNGMRPQDVVILLKIIAKGDRKWQNKDLVHELYISGSEISKSLARSEFAGLIGHDRRNVFRQSLMEFIQYGLHYVFPAQPGGMSNGILTGHSHPVIAERFHPEFKYVWPDATSYDRGLSIQPLYSTVVKAVKEDAVLYKLLAMIDVIRVGRVREMKLAIDELKKHILYGTS